MSRWDGFDEVVAVADTGNFVSAARRLGTSTSQVSRAVVRLEEQLGARFFNRTTRAVSLTDTGRTLVEQFRRIIAERDEAIAMLDVGSEPQGTLRLTCSITLGERFVAPIVLAYTKEFPRLSVELDLSNRLVDIAAEGFDLAIRTGMMTESRLIRTQIASRRFLTCASPDYLARRGIPRTIEDLENHECLQGSVETWHFKIDGNTKAFRPRGRFRCYNGQAITTAAIEGMGICHLPEFYLHRAIDGGELVPLLEQIQSTDEPIWAVYPERRHLLPKVQMLIEKLKKDLSRSINIRLDGR